MNGFGFMDVIGLALLVFVVLSVVNIKSILRGGNRWSRAFWIVALLVVAFQLFPAICWGLRGFGVPTISAVGWGTERTPELLDQWWMDVTGTGRITVNGNSFPVRGGAGDPEAMLIPLEAAVGETVSGITTEGAEVSGVLDALYLDLSTGEYAATVEGVTYRFRTGDFTLPSPADVEEDST